MRTLHRYNREYTAKCSCNIATETLGAIIGAAGSIGGATINGVASGKMNRRAERFNREEAAAQREFSERMTAQQNAWNEEMWAKATEYDSPINQVQRMREAGLNPLYYGLDGNASQSAPSAAQPLGYERAQAPAYANPVGAGIDAAYQIAQIAQTEALTKKTKSETKLNDAKLPYEVENLKSQIRKSNLESDAQETINKYIDRQQEAELRVKESTAAQADKSVEKMAAEIEKMDYEKTTMFIGWLETNERILTLQKQRELTDKQMEELASLIRKNNAEASKLGLDIANYDDITVLGTANTTMRFGPVTVQEGQPITLGMKKAAEEHARQEKEKQEREKKKPKSMRQIKEEYPE